MSTTRTTIKAPAAAKTRRPSMPGEILRELFLAPRAISISRFAAAIEVSRKHMSDVVNGKVRIEPTMAGRIAKALGTTSQTWLNLQAAVDAYDADAAVRSWKPKESFKPAEAA